MQFTRQQLIFLGAAILLAVVFLAIVFIGGRKPSEKINLTVWGIDNELAWDYAVLQYQDRHPNVRIEYTELEEESYEKELVNALAAGRGPDIFMINNRWAVKHADKIIPLPEGKISVKNFADLFPQAVEFDFLSTDSRIYGLPLSVDTLALFYNRDIFDRSGVALPPRTWEEFLAVVPKVRSIDAAGNLVLSAAAVGGASDSVKNAADILALLMLQTGALGQDKYPSETISSEAGKNALDFYTRFANPQSQSYSWNDSFAPSLDSFAEGKTAMIFGYADDIPKIKDRNPFLKFSVEPAPRTKLEESVNIADYWALTVSNTAENPDAAWGFVVFAATDKNTASYYLTSTGRPPALRSLIKEYLDDVSLGVFARQALTARSFYQTDDAAVQAVFNKAIKKTVGGGAIDEILREADAELYKLENKNNE